MDRRIQVFLSKLIASVLRMTDDVIEVPEGDTRYCRVACDSLDASHQHGYCIPCDQRSVRSRRQHRKHTWPTTRPHLQVVLSRQPSHSLLEYQATQSEFAPSLADRSYFNRSASPVTVSRGLSTQYRPVAILEAARLPPACLVVRATRTGRYSMHKTHI